MTTRDIHCENLQRVPGRALHIAQNGDLYISRRYQIFRSVDHGASWQLDCEVPSRGWKQWLSHNRLAARLLRYYIAAFQILEDGSRIAVARDGIYCAGVGEQRMSRVFAITRGSRPLNIAIDGPRVMFGEYGSGLESCQVYLYLSEDYGRTFHIAHRFPQGDIRHVHNILVDEHEQRYWVLVGDFGRQTGVGVLSKDFRHVDWLCRGTQRCRAVSAVIEPDCLVYGTDSDRERNFIVRLDKRTGHIENLREVEGSSLYACRFGPLRAISTCVEPNPECTSLESSLYLSEDAVNWHRSVVHLKDRRHPKYFQFGTLVLPYTYHSGMTGMFSGQALNEIDDTVEIVRFVPQSETVAA